MFHDFLDHWKKVPVNVARLLFEAAAEGDAVALEILHRQGVELGKSAAAIIHKLGMEQETFDVVLAGSLLTRGIAVGFASLSRKLYTLQPLRQQWLPLPQSL